MALGLLGRFGVGLLMIFFFGLEWFYPVLFELLPGRATPGKRALGLKVVMDDGLPMTPAASLIRNLLRAADFLPFALRLRPARRMLLRPDFKRLGDLAAGTLVVHAPRGAAESRSPTPRRAAGAAALDPRAQAAMVAWAGARARG